MMYEIPADDPRRIWQSQTKEHAVMSIEEIQIWSRIAQSRVRRNLIMALVFGFLLLVFCVFAIVTIPYTPLRVIAAALMVLTPVGAYKAWYLIRSPQTLPPNAALKGCLEFYRQELRAQYRSVALMWRFVVPIVTLTFLTWNTILRTSPLLPKILLPSLLVLILALRRLEARKLRHKLAMLDAFEKESSNYGG